MTCLFEISTEQAERWGLETPVGGYGKEGEASGKEQRVQDGFEDLPDVNMKHSDA